MAIHHIIQCPLGLLVRLSTKGGYLTLKIFRPNHGRDEVYYVICMPVVHAATYKIPRSGISLLYIVRVLYLAVFTNIKKRSN